MDFKEIQRILITVCLALIVTRGIEYFFFTPNTKVAAGPISGESFVVSKACVDMPPLNTEIDFIEATLVPDVVKTVVETDYAELTFSTHGASLEQLAFKRVHHGVQGDVITTVFPQPSTDKEKRCFVVGLDEEAPYYYTLSSKVDLGDRIELTYRADYAGGSIEKQFVIFKAMCRVDLMVKLIPSLSGQGSMRARIFVPAPIMSDIVAYDITSGIANDVQGSLTTLVRDSLENKGWKLPAVFGAENRYFVHSMINDQNRFAQRGYYRLSGIRDVSAIIEGPEVAKETAWTLSFYMGPKEQPAMMAVDSRLVQTLGVSGILSPIANWLLKILNLLYAYFGNYGIAIIVLTVLMKLILIPFSYKSAQGMQKNMEVNRKLKYLQQKYKDNPERLNQERMELIQKEGMPGLTGCLPLLLQLPIFFALSRVLSTSIELYRAPFAIWTDLAAPDPYYILPAFVVLVMIMQSTTLDTQQRTTMLIPAVIFGALSASFSAGLCLYIAVSTLLGVLQSMIQKKWQIA